MRGKHLSLIPRIIAIVIFALAGRIAAASNVVIDWDNCKQPNRSSATFESSLARQIDEYVKAAKAAYPQVHIALALNKFYGQIVQQRRDHVAQSYRPVGPDRTATDCALSDANYTRLIVIRDASYYILCRAEVAAGTSKAERLAKDARALTYAAIYDLLKTVGADMRAKPDEPTTPPGGFTACKRRAADGFSDSVPSSQQMEGFVSRLSVPDSEKQRIGDPEKQ